MLLRWRELRCALLLCVQLIKPNKPLIIWLGTRPVGSRAYSKFWLISIVAGLEIMLLTAAYSAQKWSLCLYVQNSCVCSCSRKKRIADWCISLIILEGMIMASEKECENGPELSPSLILWRRQLSTSAVILSSPHLTLTKHLHDTMLLTSLPSTWNYCTPLTQLDFHAVTPFWVCVSYTTLQCNRIEPHLVCLFVIFGIFFPTLTGLCVV